jgi:hypothetical protein
LYYSKTKGGKRSTVKHYKALSIVFMLFILPYVMHDSKVLAQVPLPPVLTQPLNNSTDVSLTPELHWSFVLPIGEILSYRLQVSQVPNFSSIVMDDPDVGAEHYNIPTGTLNENTRYYWRVNATVRIGLLTMTTSYSNAFSFTTVGATGITYLSEGIPSKFSLYPNFPNPFNPVTHIRFGLSGISETKLVIYDASGETVLEKSFGSLNPGVYDYEWNASGYPSGTYFYRLTARMVESLAEDFIHTRKMILVK